MTKRRNPVDPATGELVDGPVDEQTRQCFANLGSILNEAGLDYSDVVKCNVYLTTTVAVADLPFHANVETEMIARFRS